MENKTNDNAEMEGGSVSRNSHDAYDGLFKFFMSKPESAKDFFSLFMQREIWQSIDHSYLQPCPQSFVDSELEHKHVDVLYKTKFKNKIGYIYILTEQQTRPDKLLPLRMMQYIMRIIKMHQDQYKTDIFPLVYPMIYYVGKQEYPYSTNFFDGFGENKETALSLLTSSFPVASVVGVTKKELMNHPLAGTLSKVYQLAKNRDLMAGLKSLGQQFYYIDVNVGSDLILSMLKFILCKAKYGNAKKIIKAVQKMVTVQTEDKIMTLSQQLINEGMQQGMQQGMLKSMYAVARNMLIDNCSLATIRKYTNLTDDELKQLQAEVEII